MRNWNCPDFFKNWGFWGYFWGLPMELLGRLLGRIID
jgi:hypothetical protein